MTSTQNLKCDEDILRQCEMSSIYAEKPQKDIHSFIGKFSMNNGTEEPLSIENTLWSNTVVASGTVG